MTKKLTLEEVKERLEAVHGNNVRIVDDTYESLTKHATFIDIEFGEWCAQVKSVLYGRRHTKNKCIAWSNCRRHSLEEMKRKLRYRYDDLITVVDDQEYVHSHSKMKFHDKEYGTWETYPYTITNGHCSHPARGQANRTKNSKRAKTVKHWRTDATIVCTASYELAVVEWLNANKIDFDWQIPFMMPSGRTYYVDLYIKDGQFANTYVEIKGTFMRKGGDVSKQKWEWFNSTYENSRLWTGDVLISMGILQSL